MTRATLLATTAAFLFPLAGAFAQSTGSDSDMTSDTVGNSASTAGELSTESDVNAANDEDLTELLSDSANEAARDIGEATDQAMDTAGDAADKAGETAEQVGDAAASTAEDALEDTSQAADEAADAVSPDVDESATATAGAATGAMTVGELTGMTVIDAAGEDIGEIDMVVSDGNETSAVIGVGGFLGIGERDVAIPMRDFRMGANGSLELAGYTKEDLGRMPEFEEDGAQVLEADASVPDLG